MRPVTHLTRLLLAALVVPALAGCTTLGLTDLSGAGALPATELADASAIPGASPDLSPDGGPVASGDGYSLVLPAGWEALDLTSGDAFGLADALAAIDPTLGTLARTGLETSGARLSLAAFDVAAAAVDPYATGVLVATMRTRGMPKDTARSIVEDLLASAPLAAEPVHSVQGLPAGDAHRYDAVVVGDTVTLRLAIFVFRVGGQSYMVAAAAPDDRFADSEAAFQATLKSLRFGV